MAKRKQRSDGRYEAKVTVGVRPDGTYIRKAIYAYSNAELEKLLQQAKSEMNAGVDLTVHKPTVKEWADQWLNIYKASLGQSQHRTYRGNIDKWLKPIHHLKIDRVKPIQLQEILQSAAQTLSQASVNKIYNCICGIFSTAAQNRLTLIDISSVISKPTGGKKSKRDSLTPQEMKAMEQVCRTAKDGLLPALIMFCGLRIGEALALTYGDISGGYVNVTKTLTLGDNTNNVIVKDTPKTESGIRAVPLLPLTAELYNARKVAAESLSDNDYIFAGKNGQLPTRMVQRYMWNSLMQTYSSQYPDNNPPRLFTSHQLRHTYISLLYDAGVDVKTAQKWAGHASVSLTLDVYTHLSAKKEKDAESVLRNYVLTDDTSDDKVNVNC